MVQFRYKKVGRPETRTISPWQMVWENGCYYLIAYQDEKSPAGIRTTGGQMAGVWCWTLPAGARRSLPGLTCPATSKAFQHVRRAGALRHPALHRRS